MSPYGRLAGAALLSLATLTAAPAGASGRPRAPSGPPLVGAGAPAGAALSSDPGVKLPGGSGMALPGGAGVGLGGAGEALTDESSASAPPSSGDVLTGNGLSSPFCRAPLELAPAAQRNCATASFIADPNPTGDYAFDVNIDTGVSNWSNDASAVVENFTQFAWMALVAVTHGLIVMLEWCYSLDSLGGALIAHASRQLRAAHAQLTQPWLALALSIAAALAVYHGLFRRRIADTLAHALSTLAMMAIGIWLIFNPAGTVGALGQWADQASGGTLAAVAGDAADRPRRTLAAGLGDMFGAAITAPWCYLEFGDVGWCEQPRLLDGALRASALRIAKRLQSQSGCAGLCGARASASSRALAVSADLLRGARTNGELFLALPANKLERNSVKTSGTLLNVLCGGGESADRCTGPTAPQAEFRSQGAADSRVIGLLIIWLGALGMLLLFGLLALRLLSAAVTTVLYLLLAPAIVLAPTLGDAGRAVFRAWAMRLLGALVSKLTYSFLLGVVLAVSAMLLRLTLLGWWAQWLLVSAFWWTAFGKRRQTLSLLAGERHARPALGPRPITHRVAEALTFGAVARAGRAVAQPSFAPGTVGPPRRRPPATLGHEPTPRQAAAQAQSAARALAQAETERQMRAGERLRAHTQRQSELEEQRRKSAVMQDMRALACAWEARRSREGRHKDKSARLLEARDQQVKRERAASRRQLRERGPIELGPGEP